MNPHRALFRAADPSCRRSRTYLRGIADIAFGECHLDVAILLGGLAKKKKRLRPDSASARRGAVMTRHRCAAPPGINRLASAAVAVRMASADTAKPIDLRDIGLPPEFGMGRSASAATAAGALPSGMRTRRSSPVSPVHHGADLAARQTDVGQAPAPTYCRVRAAHARRRARSNQRESWATIPRVQAGLVRDGRVSPQYMRRSHDQAAFTCASSKRVTAIRRAPLVIRGQSVEGGGAVTCEETARASAPACFGVSLRQPADGRCPCPD